MIDQLRLSAICLIIPDIFSPRLFQESYKRPNPLIHAVRRWVRKGKTLDFRIRPGLSPILPWRDLAHVTSELPVIHSQSAAGAITCW
jgi:hypothetical protein